MPNNGDLRPLQPNVGFVLRQDSGYQRSIELSIAVVQLEDILLTDLVGELSLTRTSQGIWVDGRLNYETPVECGRCLASFSLHRSLELKELFYFPPSNAQNPTDYVVTEDGLLDLVDPVREQIILSIPMSPLCKPNCLGICDQCGQNRNEVKCDCLEDDIDPRLAALKDLLMDE
jgi:uncharacterized protein